MKKMSPQTRRVVQAVLYEIFAIGFVSPVLAFVFDQRPLSTLGLSLVMSTIALVWGYVFNGVFERWEARQAVKGRSWQRRVAHGLGFEGGLVVLLVPVMAYWMNTTLWAAFLADLGILAFFFVYAVVFTWAFDKVFGLPASSALPETAPSGNAVAP